MEKHEKEKDGTVSFKNGIYAHLGKNMLKTGSHHLV